MTTQEQLEELKDRIIEVEKAQEYSIGSRRLKRPELSVLYRERERLEQKLAQENDGDTFVAAFDRR
jgi:hypothetical protein